MTGLSKPLFNKCCILGMGLMGGSMGIALGKYGAVRNRWGYDINPKTAKMALKRGAIDYSGDLCHCLDGSELVILALPVRSILKCLQSIGPQLQPGTLVTDLGSTKEEIIRAMNQYLPAKIWGIGGHPMAGSEQSGIAFADSKLLENAVYILTPVKSTPHRLVLKMIKMIRVIHARPFIMEANKHDYFAALLSHLPHLVATALSAMLHHCDEDDDLLRNLVGNGFKDTTRIAMGDESIWYDIFLSNKVYLKKFLNKFQNELDLLYNYLEQEDETESKRRLRRAAALRKQLNL